MAPEHTVGLLGTNANRVEVHIPLVADPSAKGRAYRFPWISTVEEHIGGLDSGDEFDGEEVGDEYVFFLTEGSEQVLVERASTIARLPGVPKGVYAVIAESMSDDVGVGRRVDLS